MATPKFLVELVANAEQFKREMRTAVGSAQSASSQIGGAFTSVKGALAGLGVGLSVAVVAQWSREVLGAAESLKDLSDVTGSSVESLSRLNNITKIGGGNFEEIKGALEKLAPALAGVDDETGNAGRALAFLKIQARDPATALEEIAKKLNKYADGAGKAALAKDIFGRSGPGFLATLKDIAEKGNVAASVTTKQAEEATKLGEAYRTLGAQSSFLKDALQDDLVPSINKVIDRMAEGRKAAGGFWEGLKLFTDAPPWETAAEGIARVRGEIQKLEAVRAEPTPLKDFFGIKTDYTNIDANLTRYRKTLAFLQDQQIRDWGGAPTNERVNKPPAGYGGKSAATKEVDEFGKAIERLNKLAADTDGALREAFSGEAFTPARKALDELVASDSWQKLNAPQQSAIRARFDLIMSVERETQAWKDQREEQEKASKAIQEAVEQQLRARQAFTESIGVYAEQNDVLQREIAVLGADDAARQKLAATIEYESLKKRALMADDLAGLDILEQQYKKRLEIIDATAQEVRRLSEVSKLKDLEGQAFDIVGNQVENLIENGGKARDVLRALEKDLVSFITRQALAGLKNSVLGGNELNLFDFLPKLFGFGGAGSGGAASIGNLGADFVVPGFASGTSYAPGGYAWVGERGPEMMYVPRGAEITPNHQLAARRGSRGGSPDVNVYLTAPAGVNRATLRQEAKRGTIAGVNARRRG